MSIETGPRWMRRRAAAFGLRVLAGAALVALAAPAALAAYPERPIRIIVPFAPGVASDIVARLLSVPLGQVLGQNIIIENRAGANGTIGIANVAKADPDGYTLLVASSVFVVNPTLAKHAAYDPIKDFSAISNLGASPNVILTRPDTGIKDLAELITRARANPYTLNFSSTGMGSITQLSIELLKIRAGIRLIHVPYTGAGPAVQAVLSGTVPLGVVNIAAAIEHIKDGTLKALAQTGRERWPNLPDVPTLTQAGIANAESETFQALFAPAGTPKDIVRRLTHDITDILRRPDIRSRMQTAGLGIVAMGPDALQTRVVHELAMWKDVIEKSGLKIE
jgi:tripartite-type tricarboxylate transporter receptor subunit TctC